MRVSGLKEHDDIAAVMLIVQPCLMVFSSVTLGTFTLHLCAKLSVGEALIS